MSVYYTLEFISEVQEEVCLLGAVAVAEAGTDGTEDGIVVIGYLPANQSAIVEDFLQLAGLLSCSQAEQYVMIVADALLSLELSGNELLPDVLYVAYAGEGHLLLYVMAEPFAADGIAENRRNHVAKEQAAIDHRLEGEALAQSERHAPVGIDAAHARVTVELHEVIGQVGILSLEAGTTGGKFQLSSLL